MLLENNENKNQFHSNTSVYGDKFMLNVIFCIILSRLNGLVD